MLTNSEFSEISKFVKSNYGINLTNEKKALVISRLENYIKNNNYGNFSSYMDAVRGDNTGKLMLEFLNRITTNHSYFWREKDHFDYFKKIVLPELKVSKSEKDLRIWSAGCSSGQEAYTLAMIMDDFLGLEKNAWNTKILATDISDRALSIGREGLYKKEEALEMPKYYLTKYFDNLDSTGIRVKSNLKNEIIFRRLNLLSNYPFKKKIDVIFCRNVMIYFDFETKHKIMRRFYDVLEDGGYLFIGHSESLDRKLIPFEYVLPSIYRK